MFRKKAMGTKTRRVQVRDGGFVLLDSAPDSLESGDQEREKSLFRAPRKFGVVLVEDMWQILVYLLWP